MQTTIIYNDPDTGMEAIVKDATTDFVLGTVDDCSTMEWANPAFPFEVRDCDFEEIGSAPTVEAGIAMILGVAVS
jgi:hypothetical protein